MRVKWLFSAAVPITYLPITKQYVFLLCVSPVRKSLSALRGGATSSHQMEMSSETLPRPPCTMSLENLGVHISSTLFVASLWWQLPMG